MARAVAVGLVAVSLSIVAASCGGGASGFSGPPLPEFEPKTPNDEFYDNDGSISQWNMTSIEMPHAWGTLFADEVAAEVNDGSFPFSVVVAVLDTAVNVEHGDLTANLIDGYNLLPENGDEISVGRFSGAGLSGDRHHGSHVAGVIGADTDNEKGIAGVGWNQLQVMPVTVLNDDGSGYVEDLIDGLMFAAGLTKDGEPAPARPADVINLSLGLGGDVPALRNALQDVVDAGITVIAAAGNDGCGTDLVYPARYPTTVAVGSANPPDNARAPYSNCGDALDLVAPGGSGLSDGYEGIYSLSADGDDGYIELTGTSMATPHVAGVAGLLYAVSDSMTPARVARILRETATPLPHSNSDPNTEYGWGMLHAERALRRALMHPFGPYEDDGSATTRTFRAFGLSAESTSESGETGAETLSRKPPASKPDRYRNDRVVLTINSEWYAATGRTERRERFAEISDAHGLRAIVDRGHRFPPALLTGAHEPNQELLQALAAEPEIESASFDSYVKHLSR